jgi:hypothetical protein
LSCERKGFLICPPRRIVICEIREVCVKLL